MMPRVHIGVCLTPEDTQTSDDVIHVHNICVLLRNAGWSFAQAQPCLINTCGCVDMNTHMCVCVFGKGQVFWFYMIVSSVTSLKTHYIPIRIPWTWLTFLSPMCLSIYILSILQDQFQMLCLSRRFLIALIILSLNSHKTSLYFSCSDHTLPCIICLLFLLSCKLLENLDISYAMFLLLLPMSTFTLKYDILNAIGTHKCTCNGEIKGW